MSYVNWRYIAAISGIANYVKIRYQVEQVRGKLLFEYLLKVKDYSKSNSKSF